MRKLGIKNQVRLAALVMGILSILAIASLKAEEPAQIQSVIEIEKTDALAAGDQ